jgi:hypothetical protein
LFTLKARSQVSTYGGWVQRRFNGTDVIPSFYLPATATAAAMPDPAYVNNMPREQRSLARLLVRSISSKVAQ